VTDPGVRSEVEAIYSRIAARLLPILVLLFVVAWLDRVNVGFAKLQMLEDRGFSEAVFGFGAGIFYLGYLLFEIPSNLLLHRIGARKTLARIAFLFGVTSIANAFVLTEAQFYIVRFLLGVFEAGLYPGVILYLTYWFPARHRARMMGWFMTGIPLAGIVGGPISGWLMSMMGGRAGLANWQWLFLLEGVPSIVLAIVTLTMIADTPADASWLTAAQKQLVLEDLEADQRAAGPREHGLGKAFRTPRVWLLTAIYFCLVSANPTFGFWGPTIISEMGVTNNATIGLLSAVPYAVAMAGVVLVGRSSDQRLERRYHCAFSCVAAAVGLVLIGVFAQAPPLAFAALVLGVTGVLSAFAPFWPMPTMMLAGTGAAAGIALINSIGNLSGWIAPFVVGWLLDSTGSAAAGLYVVAALEVTAAVLIVVFIPRRISD
jgi:D-galactonate transporter